jgi:hypothetical protein
MEYWSTSHAISDPRQQVHAENHGKALFDRMPIESVYQVIHSDLNQSAQARGAVVRTG